MHGVRRRSGQEIATELAREGAGVMLSGHNAERLAAAQENIERETGNCPETFVCDVNKAEDIQALVPGDVFGPGGESCLRMSFANRCENVAAGCEQLRKAMKELRKQ